MSLDDLKAEEERLNNLKLELDKREMNLAAWENRLRSKEDNFKSTIESLRKRLSESEKTKKLALKQMQISQEAYECLANGRDTLTGYTYEELRAFAKQLAVREACVESKIHDIEYRDGLYRELGTDVAKLQQQIAAKDAALSKIRDLYNSMGDILSNFNINESTE